MPAAFTRITMRRRFINRLLWWTTSFGFAALVLAPSPADARQKAPRVEAAANFGLAAPTKEFTRTSVLRLNVEDGSLTAQYGLGTSPLIDFGAGVRVTRRIWISGAFSRFAGEADSNLSAHVPHPLFFGQLRDVTGVAGASRKEVGIHVQIQAAIPAGDRLVIKFGAGPTIAKLDQDIFNTIEYSEAYPFDSATFTGATPVIQSKSAIGFNAGADVTIKTGSRVGVGALVRFSRATVKLEPSTGSSVSVTTGGLQVGGGIRLAF